MTIGCSHVSGNAPYTRNASKISFYFRVHENPHKSLVKPVFNFKKWWLCNLNAIHDRTLLFSFQNVKAQRAMMEMRGFSLKGSRLQTDYASHECRARFFELCKKYGIDIKERSRPWEEDNSQDSSYRYVNPQLDLSFHS